jgi:hypothetical protein
LRAINPSRLVAIKTDNFMALFFMDRILTADVRRHHLKPGYLTREGWRMGHAGSTRRMPAARISQANDYA